MEHTAKTAYLEGYLFKESAEWDEDRTWTESPRPAPDLSGYPKLFQDSINRDDNLYPWGKDGFVGTLNTRKYLDSLYGDPAKVDKALADIKEYTQGITPHAPQPFIGNIPIAVSRKAPEEEVNDKIFFPGIPFQGIYAAPGGSAPEEDLRSGLVPTGLADIATRPPSMLYNHPLDKGRAPQTRPVEPVEGLQHEVSHGIHPFGLKELAPNAFWLSPTEGLSRSFFYDESDEDDNSYFMGAPSPANRATFPIQKRVESTQQNKAQVLLGDYKNIPDLIFKLDELYSPRVYPARDPAELYPAVGALQRHLIDTTGDRINNVKDAKVFVDSLLNRTMADIAKDNTLSMEAKRAATYLLYTKQGAEAYRYLRYTPAYRSLNIFDRRFFDRNSKMAQDTFDFLYRNYIKLFPAVIARNTDAYQDGYTHRTA